MLRMLEVYSCIISSTCCWCKAVLDVCWKCWSYISLLPHRRVVDVKWSSIIPGCMLRMLKFYSCSTLSTYCWHEGVQEICRECWRCSPVPPHRRVVLLYVLSLGFGVTDRVFKWVQSYHNGRTQVFFTGVDFFEVASIVCSIPLGSVAGQLWFIAYTEDLKKTSGMFTFNHHIYADDMQLPAHLYLKNMQYIRSDW